MDTQTKGYRFEEKDHVHTLNGKRLHGTTTVLGVLSKPLTWWAAGMAVKQFGWLDPKKHSEEECDRAALEAHERIVKMATKDFQDHLSRAYRAHATELKTSADRGTNLHALIEEWVKYKMGEGPQPLFRAAEIEPFVRWAETNVKEFLAAEKCVYSERLWVGGKFDLMYRGMDGRVYMGDIKSASGAYFSHFVQMGAYRTQYEENGLFDDSGRMLGGAGWAGMVNGYAVFPMGQKNFTGPTVSFRVDEYSDAFEAALSLYKISKSFEEGVV